MTENRPPVDPAHCPQTAYDVAHAAESGRQAAQTKWMVGRWVLYGGLGLLGIFVVIPMLWAMVWDNSWADKTIKSVTGISMPSISVCSEGCLWGLIGGDDNAKIDKPEVTTVPAPTSAPVTKQDVDGAEPVVVDTRDCRGFWTAPWRWCVRGPRGPDD